MRTTKGIDVPVDLEEAFRDNPRAWEGFQAMRIQSQKDFVVAIEATQGPVSRAQRVEKTIREAERHQDLRPLMGVRLA